MKQHKNLACLTCNYVIAKDNEPYCTLRQALTEQLPPIRCEADCHQRKVSWVEELPDLVVA